MIWLKIIALKPDCSSVQLVEMTGILKKYIPFKKKGKHGNPI